MVLTIRTIWPARIGWSGSNEWSGPEPETATSFAGVKHCRGLCRHPGLSHLACREASGLLLLRATTPSLRSGSIRREAELLDRDGADPIGFGLAGRTVAVRWGRVWMLVWVGKDNS